MEKLSRSSALPRPNTNVIAPCSQCPLGHQILSSRVKSPHRALSSSFSPVRRIPANTDCLLPSRDLFRSRPFPPTNRGVHECDGALTRDVLRNQEEHRRARLLRPSPTRFHFLDEEFHNFLTLPLDRSCETVGSKPSHPAPVAAQWPLAAFSESSLILGNNSSSKLLSFAFLHGLSSISCTSVLHCHWFANSFFFASHIFRGLASRHTCSNTELALSKLLVSCFHFAIDLTILSFSSSFLFSASFFTSSNQLVSSMHFILHSGKSDASLQPAIVNLLTHQPSSVSPACIFVFAC